MSSKDDFKVTNRESHELQSHPNTVDIPMAQARIDQSVVLSSLIWSLEGGILSRNKLVSTTFCSASPWWDEFEYR